MNPARNVEIKARLTDPGATVRLADALADGPEEDLKQTDVYFQVPQGRLKLRIFGDGSGELIQYRRPDARDPEVSEYRRVAAPEPVALRAALAGALGERVVVTKRRRVLLIGRTRVHFDQVDGLGTFLELEVVLRDGEDRRAGEAEARALLQALQISGDDLVDVGYADLLEARADRACTSN